MNSTSETLHLDYPTTCNGMESRTLTLRRPTVGDLLNSQQGRNDQESGIALLSHLCSISPDDIKQMDLSDYQGARTFNVAWGELSATLGQAFKEVSGLIGHELAPQITRDSPSNQSGQPRYLAAWTKP